MYEDQDQDGVPNLIHHDVRGFLGDHIAFAWKYEQSFEGSGVPAIVVWQNNTLTGEMVAYTDYLADGIFEAYQTNDDFYILYQDTWHKTHGDGTKIIIDGEEASMSVRDNKWVRDSPNATED